MKIILNKPFTYITEQKYIPYVLEQCSKVTRLGLDIETTRNRNLPKDLVFNEQVFKPGLDPYLSEVRLLQLSTPTEIFVMDCWYVDITPLASLFYNSQITKIGHNLKFDTSMLMLHYGFRFRRLFDTMLASQILSNGISAHIRKHSLYEVCLRYLRISLDKEEQRSDWSILQLTKSQIEYAAKDVDVLEDLAMAQIALAVNDELGINLTKIFRLEFDCLIATARMELNGLNIDERMWNDLDAQIKIEYLEISDNLKKALGKEDINLDSPIQIKKALLDLGLEVESTNSKELELYKDRHPVIPLLLHYRGVAKLLSSYLNGIPGKKRKKNQTYLIERRHPITGRIHPTFNQCLTETGRFSAQDPNSEQVPKAKRFRQCFRAPIVDDIQYAFIAADYSNCELRILAEVTGDAKLIEAFKSGRDVHTFVAAMMFRVSEESIMYKDPQTKKKVEGENIWMRDAAKSISFGLIYGRGPRSLADQIGVSYEEAIRLTNLYFETFPSIKDYLDKQSLHAVRAGFSQTALGRVRYYEFDRRNRKEIARVGRQGANMGIQGCNADITKIAMYRLNCVFEDVYDNIVKLTNVIHDEFSVECPPDLAAEIEYVVKSVMEEAEAEVMKNNPVLAEVEVGYDWSVK